MSHLRRNPVPYLALLLVLAVGVGGGYALAASNSKTITVCADKKTGVLHLKTRGRCKSSQTRVTWNQQGPQGVQGSQGAAGPQGPAGAQGPVGSQGPAGVTVWANVADNGTVVAGQGVAVQHVSPGTYQVTITAQACAQRNNAPTISVSDAAPGLVSGGGFPVAWYGATGGNVQFMVYTGLVSPGPSSAFTPTDHTFDVLDACE
jgi:hypothetical protein